MNLPYISRHLQTCNCTGHWHSTAYSTFH